MSLKGDLWREHPASRLALSCLAVLSDKMKEDKASSTHFQMTSRQKRQVRGCQDENSEKTKYTKINKIKYNGEIWKACQINLFK